MFSREQSEDPAIKPFMDAKDISKISFQSEQAFTYNISSNDQLFHGNSTVCIPYRKYGVHKSCREIWAVYFFF